MTKHVLTVDYWFRQEDIGRKRYHRGSELDDLTSDEVRFLTEAGAIAAPGSDAGKRAAAHPVVPQPERGPVEVDAFNQSTYLTSEANSGIGPEDATGGLLSDDQVAEESTLTARLTGEVDHPARSATVDEWRRWAVKSGKATADQAEQMNKGELQALT